MVQVDVEIPAGFRGVLAHEPRIIAFVDGDLQRFAFANIFAAQIDISGMRAHRERGDQAAFNQRVGIMAHDLPVLAGAGFGFVGVDDKVGRAPIAFLRHERPFQTGGKARPTASTQAAVFHLLNDRVAAAADDLSGAVPMAAGHRAFQGAVAHPVEVCEDAVLVVQHVFAFSRLVRRGRRYGAPPQVQ